MSSNSPEAVAPEPSGPAPADPTPATEDSHPHQSVPILALAALGIVFGDIGTSPLYSLQTVFSIEHNQVKPIPVDVYGVISTVFWALILVVTIKYVALVMRADNDGEGGILALVALLLRTLQRRPKLAGAVLVMGMFGAALFYGDSVITPAISVMSAIEGLAVADPELEEFVLPLAVAVLSALFVVQRWGTALVGKAFGPVMMVWFATLGVLGVPHILHHPEILKALSPHYSFAFFLSDPFTAFISMGAVVLAVTGAEALYADMGHFGAGPIRISWFSVVLPGLILNYMGQGAMLLHQPEAIDNPFYRMAPAWSRLPLVALATVATVIASQAVISGAFSVSRQAVRLGLLPRLLVRHTSKVEGGQIYVPAINTILYVGVLILIVVFGSSQRLATAYGLAVTGTLMLTMLLFLVLAYFVWRWPLWLLGVIAVFIGGMELVFFGANLTKLVSGGWVPLIIAGLVVLVMTTWRKGAGIITELRAGLEGPLASFVRQINEHPIPRVPGIAVFPHRDAETTPLALRSNLEFNHVLHERVVIVSIVNENVPHVRHVDRVTVNDLGYADDGIVHVSCRVGFNDSQDVPKALALAAGANAELDLDPADANYFLSVLNLEHAGDRRLGTLRNRLFVWLERNQADRTEVFHLPPERTIVMGARMEF